LDTVEISWESGFVRLADVGTWKSAKLDQRGFYAILISVFDKPNDQWKNFRLLYIGKAYDQTIRQRLGQTRIADPCIASWIKANPGTLISNDDPNKALEMARKASAVYLPYLDPMTEFVGISKDEISSVKSALYKGDTELASSLVSEKSVNAFKLWGTPKYDHREGFKACGRRRNR
jgi:hypothetical protein